ncbi:unnamed protein product [Oreochromis niloticus]|nr:unnamed protein product [Mustela putorius furo]
MSYIYQWLDVPWGDGDMGSWADRSPLHEAASQGRLLALRTLLAQGYHANIVTIDHVTPLHEACLSGHVACVRALLNAGANVNAATIDGVTPLYNCCASGSIGCMELLLQSGAHTRASHTHFPSALHEACKRGNSHCVEALLSHGADPDYEVSHLGSPLYVSCLHRHTACSQVLLHRDLPLNLLFLVLVSSLWGTDLSVALLLGSGLTSSTRRKYRFPDLSHSSKPTCLNWLTRFITDVSVGRGGDSPLHAAVRQDSADQVSLLLDYGANTNFRDSNNQRPVELAPPGGKTHQLLLAFEASPRSLCQLCRLQIRNLIGRSRLNFLPVLPLPSPLTHYLEYRSNEQ